MEFDPYQKWLHVTNHSASTTHYELLGLQAFESDPTRIRNAYDRASGEVHKWEASNKYAETATEILHELAGAYLCLSEPQTKQEYDRQLQTRTTASEATAAVETNAGGFSLKDLLDEYSPVVGGPQTGQHLAPASLPARRTQTAANRFPAPLIGGAIVAGLVVLALGAAFVSRLQNSTTELAGSEGVGTVLESSPQDAIPAGETVAADSASDGQAGTESAAVPDRATHDEQGNSSSADPFSEAAAAVPPPILADSTLDRDSASSTQTSPGTTGLDDAQPASFHDERLVPERATPESDRDGATLADTHSDPFSEPHKLSEARLPPPSSDVQQAIIAQINGQYHAEQAASSVAKVRLAKELIEAAERTSDKPDERFVLLRTAAELSCDGCDVELMLQAVDSLAGGYDVPEPEVHAHMLKRLLANGDRPERVMAFLRNCGPVIGRALAVDKLDLAVEMADLAGGFGERPVGSVEFRKELQTRQARVRSIGEQFQQHQAALARLAAAPDDADAHATAGRWLCLVKGHWDEGLPHLSQGSDARLKKLAQQELSAANAAPDVLVALGDEWCETAQSAEAHEQLEMLRRADDWYRRAAESLSGLARAEIDGRRKEIGQRLACLAPEEVQPASPLDAAKPSSASAEDSESQDLQVLFERALAAGMSGNDFTRAERLLSRCNQLDPQHVPTLNNLALMSLRNRNYRRAVHLWETAAELAPEDAAVQHNLQCLLRLAHANRLSLDRSALSSMERLCGPAGRNDAPRGRSYDGWQFLPYGPGGSSDNYADYRCLHCGGTGSVPCTASGCNGGTVGVQRSDVVGRARNGMPIIKKYTVRQRCSRCYGRGVITCPTCGGSGRSSF